MTRDEAGSWRHCETRRQPSGDNRHLRHLSRPGRSGDRCTTSGSSSGSGSGSEPGSCSEGCQAVPVARRGLISGANGISGRRAVPRLTAPVVASLEARRQIPEDCGRGHGIKTGSEQALDDHHLLLVIEQACS